MKVDDLSAWLAAELGGRVTKTDFRTGALLRRTAKVVAVRDGLSWECYVNAALWNRRPRIDTLQRRIRVLRAQFARPAGGDA